MIGVKKKKKNKQSFLSKKKKKISLPFQSPTTMIPNPTCPKCLKLVYAAEQIMGPGRKVRFLS